MRTITKVTEQIREALAQSERALRPLGVAAILGNRLGTEANTFEELAEARAALREYRSLVLDANQGLNLAQSYLDEADELSAVDREERQLLASAETDLSAALVELAQKNTDALTARADAVRGALDKAEARLERLALARQQPRDQLLAQLLRGVPVIEERADYRLYEGAVLSPELAQTLVDSNDPVRPHPAGMPLAVLRQMVFREDGTPEPDTVRHAAAVAQTGESVTVQVRVTHPAKVVRDQGVTTHEQMRPTPIADSALDKRPSSSIVTSHNDIPEWQKAGRGWAGHGTKW